MKKEHKIATGITIGASVLVIGGVLAWGRTQSQTDATQNVTLERLHVKQEAMAEDISEIKAEQISQRGTLTKILTEVKKMNGGE